MNQSSRGLYFQLRTGNDDHHHPKDMMIKIYPRDSKESFTPMRILCVCSRRSPQRLLESAILLPGSVGGEDAFLLFFVWQ